MKVTILCGGKGTRIRDVNDALPKPMLPIGDRPILWHIMKLFSHYGFDEFVLCLGHKGWTIKEFFLNYRAMTSDVRLDLAGHSSAQFDGAPIEPWRIILAETGEETMTGGRVAAVRRYLEADELFLLTYGDGVGDIDIRKLVEFHRQHGRLATLTAVRPASRFGELRMDGAQVTEFREKPRATTGFINGGFLVFDAKRIWNYLPNDPTCVLEREPLQRLAADGQLMAFEHTGFWEPMDTFRDYKLLNDLWESSAAPWKVWKDPTP
jgi:glucose-1-phosphate cytidylyltransferase